MLLAKPTHKSTHKQLSIRSGEREFNSLDCGSGKWSLNVGVVLIRTPYQEQVTQRCGTRFGITDSVKGPDAATRAVCERICFLASKYTHRPAHRGILYV